MQVVGGGDVGKVVSCVAFFGCWQKMDGYHESGHKGGWISCMRALSSNPLSLFFFSPFVACYDASTMVCMYGFVCEEALMLACSNKGCCILPYMRS